MTSNRYWNWQLSVGCERIGCLTEKSKLPSSAGAEEVLTYFDCSIILPGIRDEAAIEISEADWNS